MYLYFLFIYLYIYKRHTYIYKQDNVVLALSLLQTLIHQLSIGPMKSRYSTRCFSYRGHVFSFSFFLFPSSGGICQEMGPEMKICSSRLMGSNLMDSTGRGTQEGLSRERI